MVSLSMLPIAQLQSLGEKNNLITESEPRRNWEVRQVRRV